MRFLRLCSAVVVAGVAAAGLVLFTLGLVDQARRFRLYHVGGVGFHDPGCGVAFCDSSVFWLAGRLAAQGSAAAAYDVPAFARFGAAVLPGHTLTLPFVYTPVTLLPAALLSLAPLAAGYVAFSVVSVVLFVLALRRAGIGWVPVLLGLVSPAAMWSLYLGQFGLVCGALLLAGLAGLGRRPVQAGVSLALLAMKPPYALLVPVVVLAGRYWRAMLAGGVTLVLLGAMSLACFGVQAWAAFLGPGRAAARVLLVAPFAHGGAVLGVSVFWMLRSLGGGLATAGCGQAVVSVAAVGLVAWLWRRPAADEWARLLATVCLALLAVPYAYADDMVALSVALPLGWRRGATVGNAVLAVVWLSPALTGHFLRALGFLPEPVFIVAAFGVGLVRQAVDAGPGLRRDNGQVGRG